MITLQSKMNNRFSLKQCFIILIESQMLKSKIENSMKKVLSKSKKTQGTIYGSFRSTQNANETVLKFNSTILHKKQKSSDKKIKTLSKKPISTSTNTPKHITAKMKENIYGSIFKSQGRSPISTPIQYEKIASIEMKGQRRNDYKFLYQIGSGGFGRVWKVQNKSNGEILAMKEISKAKVILKKSVGSVINQKEILQELSNPFIINMCNAFQDRDFLYLTMEYLRGGDLRYHLCFYENFSQEQTKFIVACIVLGLQYIHANNIIHRDLKPQNLIFQQNGYLRITDFGVAREQKLNNNDETSGTPGYMAPQVICRMNHSFQADFFALGVIIYETILGIRPYIGQSRKQIRDKILAHQAKITEKQLPNGWSLSVIDFVNRLLKRNKQSRLGFNGISELKQHPWLSSINWSKLKKKQIKPPFIPGVNPNIIQIISESQQYQQQMQNTEVSQVDEQTTMLLRTDQIQKLFKAYEKRKKISIKKKTKIQTFKKSAKIL